jgi:hypothetical protein
MVAKRQPEAETTYWSNTSIVARIKDSALIVQPDLDLTLDAKEVMAHVRMVVEWYWEVGSNSAASDYSKSICCRFTGDEMSDDGGRGWKIDVFATKRLDDKGLAGLERWFSETLHCRRWTVISTRDEVARANVLFDFYISTNSSLLERMCRLALGLFGHTAHPKSRPQFRDSDRDHLRPASRHVRNPGRTFGTSAVTTRDPRTHKRVEMRCAIGQL